MMKIRLEVLATSPLVTAYVALPLVEGMKTYAPVNIEERRTLLKHSTLSIGTISLLAILGSFLIVEEGNVKKEKEELEKKQEVFNAQKS